MLYITSHKICDMKNVKVNTMIGIKSFHSKFVCEEFIVQEKNPHKIIKN